MAHIPYIIGEIEHDDCAGQLGLLSVSEGGMNQEYLPAPTTKPEAIFDELWAMAKTIWPDDMTKAEEWVKAQAARYVIADTKAQAVAVSQSSVTWIVLGLAVGWFLTRKK